jgi:hypothetical protein
MHASDKLARLQNTPCLKWVKNGGVQARAARPFYPQEQTSSACPGMSVWCTTPEVSQLDHMSSSSSDFASLRSRVSKPSLNQP